MVRASVKGTTAVTVHMDCPMDAKMNKRNNPFMGQGIVKRETLNGIIGYDYGNAVNRLAGKEGKEERETKVHPWGDMDSQRLFRIHRKTFLPYLSMKVENVKVHGYFTPEEVAISKDDIKPFLKKKSKSSTQEDLEGEVIARDFGLENITSVRMKGEEYVFITEVNQETENTTDDNTEITETEPA